MKKKLLDGFFFFACTLILILLLSGVGIAPLEKSTRGEAKDPKIQTAEETKLEPVDIHLVAVGDYMIHRPQIRAATTSDGLDFKENFKHLKDLYLEPADVAMLNFETTISAEGLEYTTFPVFSSPVEILRDMKDAGFNLLATSNNHCFDTGVAGVERTLDAIEAHGMKGFGTYRQEESEPLIYEVKGVKLGLASYTYGINGFEASLESSEHPGAVSFLNEDKIKSDLKWLRDQGAEALIVYVHWGEEYMRRPTETQRQWMNFFADEGVDQVLGSHPHVIQEMEILERGDHKTYGIYSMGNFVSNQRREYMGQSYSESGLLMDMTIHRNEDGNISITRFEPVPLIVDYYHDGAGSHYEVLPVRESLEGKIELPRLDIMRGKLSQSLEQFYELFPDQQERGESEAA